jgi:hypothetical protein
LDRVASSNLASSSKKAWNPNGFQAFFFCAIWRPPQKPTQKPTRPYLVFLFSSQSYTIIAHIKEPVRNLIYNRMNYPS